MIADPAEAQARIYELYRDNEEMIGYMMPNLATQNQIRLNCVRIAQLALQIEEFCAQDEVHLTPKQARSAVQQGTPS